MRNFDSSEQVSHISRRNIQCCFYKCELCKRGFIIISLLELLIIIEFNPNC